MSTRPTSIDRLPAHSAESIDGSLSMIMPALNEEANIESAIHRSLEALATIASQFEIIVIDDGSTDRTGEIVDRISAEEPRVRVLHNERNRNYGCALRQGFQAARFEWVFHDGADLPLAPEDFSRFIGHLSDADIVIARRTSRDAHSAWRRLTSWTHNQLVRLLFWPQSSDLNFVQFYRRSMVNSLPVHSTSPAFVTPELILRAERSGKRVREVQVEFRRRQAGKAHFGKPRDIAWCLRDMMRFRMRTLLRGWDS